MALEDFAWLMEALMQCGLELQTKANKNCY